MRTTRLQKPTAAQLGREPLPTAGALLRRGRWSRRPPWEGFGEPLNGQQIRRRTVEALIESFGPDALIETGTFMGFTTRYLAATGLPVHSVEVDPGYFNLARISLRDLPDVELLHGDSADGLRELAKRTIHRPLLYLDAHWQERLPLADELECVFESWGEAVIVVDDFLVPADPGYGYDIYGGTPLSLQHFELGNGALAAFPAAPAVEETGSRRGTLYVSHGPEARAALEAAVEQGLLAPAD